MEKVVTERVFAVVGLFDSAQALIDAIPKVRRRNLGRVEAYTPYPVHGIEAALGLRRSPLAGMVLVMGMLGAITAMLLEWWTSVVDYPIQTGGKALFSWQAFVPIMFEVMVLFATFTAGLGMLLLLNKLPFFSHPVLSSRAMVSITKDKFALAVEADGAPLDAAAARLALEEAGAGSLELVESAPSDPLSAKFLQRTALGIIIACAVSGYATYWAIKMFPVLPPMVHMLKQPRLDAQQPSAFFKDGRGMRMPVAGSISRGHMPLPVLTPEQAAALVNPLARTEEVMSRGRKAFNTYCSVCHGALGDGVPTLTAAYGAKPANLQSKAIRDYSDGTIYDTIIMGKNSMPSYAPMLSEDERWATVHYLRALQRSRNALDKDLP
jgi:mono/diheme cytochrome c family protein